MLSLNDIKRLTANSIYGLNPCHDRWKFNVTIPSLDDSKLRKVIENSQYVDQSSITATYTPGKTVASFEVTDYSFSEWLKDCIRREHDMWWYAVDHIREPITVTPYTDEDFKLDYKRILSSISGLPIDASDKEHAEAIVKEDTKMSKVKTQAPTWYSSYKKFTKVIRSGPVTVAWIEGKKVMVRKTKKDKDDLEKAMLMLYAKSQFSSEASFHRWFRDQMELFEEANKNAKN